MRDLKGAGIVDRGIIFPKSSFNRIEIRTLALDFLRTQAKGVAIARLVMAPDELSVNQNYVHGTPHNTYESTVVEIMRRGFPTGPLARLLAINGRGKISYLENGELTEEILADESDYPTVLHDGQHEYELLHFILSSPRPETLGPHSFSTRMFFKASPDVSASSCVRLFDMVRKLITVDQLLIHIRADPWFMEEQRYPAVLAFTKPLEIPNPVHYTIGSVLDCSAIDGRVRCSGTNFLP